MQEFANKNAEGDFFSATPDAYEIDLVHIKALIEEHEIRYLDYTRAFLHAPEMETIFTDPPAGFERPGLCWRLKRKINGRRDGTQTFTEWAAMELQHCGWSRSALHPCTFTRIIDGQTCVTCGHVDDVVLTGPMHALDIILKELEERILVEVTGNMYPDKESAWIPFVGRERRRVGNKILMRVNDKFVQIVAELLGLESAKTMDTPTTKELYHKEGTNKLDDEEKHLVRQVVGMLHYIQGDYKLA